jgi:O-succinylbenzoic acid--CoA ligase
MASSARATGEFFQLAEGSRALLCLPAASIAGKMMLVRAMILGWELTMVAPSVDPLAGLGEHFDFAAMVPMQLTSSLNKLNSVETILLGGAPLSAGLLARIPEKGTVIYEGYGMTETSSHIALRKLSPVPEKTDPEQVLPPFQALPGITLEQDERGCLVIQATRLSPEPIVTNDLVSLVNQEEFRWLGRVDNVVNSGGVKLLPEQLESRLNPFMEQRFFLTGLPDDTLGEKLVLVVEGQAPDNLLQTLREAADLSKFEVPKETLSVPEFALTPTGKINRPEILKTLS